MQADANAMTVSITRGWRPMTGIRGNGLAVIGDGRFALYDGAGRELALAPVELVRAAYTRFTWHGSVTVWVGGERYVLGRGGPPSTDQAQKFRFALATGGNPAGAATSGMRELRDFTRRFAQLFTAAGGNWGRPPRTRS